MSLAGFLGIPLPFAQLSLAAVLKSGQSFRWSILTSSTEYSTAISEPDHLRVEYRLCLRDRVVRLRQSTDTLFYRSIFPDPSPLDDIILEREAETLAWLKDYFQLNIDLVVLYKEWAKRDTVFASFQTRFVGIRMLRQDPWENLISFICSSNNNISRITKMIQNLCKQFSPAILSVEHPFVPGEILIYHPFPPPSALADPAVALQLRSLGFGYRADFIQKTAKMLVDTHGSSTSTLSQQGIEAAEIWLAGLRNESTTEAREKLLKFVGVGRKVADCILLMSLDKKEVIPVDTHVYHIAMKYYGLSGSANGKTAVTPKVYENINSKLCAIWGDYAGWAHLVLFTADLKSFASYGLPVQTKPPPSPSPRMKKQEQQNKLLTPARTPSRSPLKRSLYHDTAMECELATQDAEVSELREIAEDSLSIVDRVKKRRRTRRV